jgi:catechol 2,3-dioxygenase-like lactoylglutathione lyase family enzyme
MKLESHATVLLVPDVRRAGDHYRDRLGFEVTYYDRIPSHYAYASRDGVYLHFARVDGAVPRPNSQAAPPDMFDVTSMPTTWRPCTRSWSGAART